MQAQEASEQEWSQRLAQAEDARVAAEQEWTRKLVEAEEARAQLEAAATEERSAAQVALEAERAARDHSQIPPSPMLFSRTLPTQGKAGNCRYMLP